MSRRLISELPPQTKVDQVFLATHKQLRPNRNGQFYLQVDLADKSGTIAGRLWNASDADYGSFADGDYVHVEGHTQLFSGAMQIIITAIERADPGMVDEREFRVLSTTDIERLLAELRGLLTGLRPPLDALVATILGDDALMGRIARTPAGVKHHHAYAGGLLDHVVNLMRLADLVAPLYPDMDRDLLLVGVLVHDIGKTIELESDKGFSYTDPGQLLGHILLGLEIIDAKIHEVERHTEKPFDAETATRVKHMIASHHGSYEFGSPRLPMTLEAVALHHLDHLDAKMAGTIQLLRSEASLDGGWTQYQQAQGRKFFRGHGP
jgi:3'-5' exoribonuclease